MGGPIVLTTVVLTSAPKCSDGGSGYDLPKLNAGSGLQPAPRGPACGKPVLARFRPC